MLSLVVRSLLATVVAVHLLGCGGGGGGGGGDGGNGTVIVPPGTFGVTTGPDGGKLGGLNVPVLLIFSKPVDPDTVSPVTIKVVSVTDPSGIATAPPGHLAQADLTTSGSSVTISPQVEFHPDKVEYGFLADALYEIAFSPPSSLASVKSDGGESMVNPNVTFYFRTPTMGFDFNPGYPHVRAYVVDDPDDGPPSCEPLDEIIVDTGDGDLVPEAVSYFCYDDAPGDEPLEITADASPVELPTTTAQSILFVFDDALIPSSVVNPLNGTSPSIVVTINAAAAPELNPKTLPGQFSVIHQQGNLTLVLWQTAFEDFPPDSFLFVDVLPTVQDLAGNSKQLLLGTGIPDLSASLEVTSGFVGTFSMLEPFDDSQQEDADATSADWAVADDSSGEAATVLAPVLGGGTGEDGLLVIDPEGTTGNPGDTEVPPVAVVDFAAKTVALPTVEPAPGGFEPREWAFSSISIPVGWTLSILHDREGDGTLDPNEYLVQSPGHPLDGLGAPLQLRCTGLIEIFGRIDVTGQPAATLDRPFGVADPDFAAYLGQGAEGATALAAAGDGGSGGDVLLLDENGEIVFPLISPSPDFESSDGKLRGVTGLSTGLTASTLSDATRTFTRLSDPGDEVLSGLLADGEIRLAPNLGVGSSLVGNAGTPNESIDENHPTFVLAGVSDDATVSVTTQFGDLTQPSENFGTAYAPIASAGDSYLVGRLHGLPGGDATNFARGGRGAEPYVVVNEGALGVTTTGGGGGGGGGIEAGADGDSDGPESDPDVNQRGGSHGIAKDDSVGAAGGVGAMRGQVMALGPNPITRLGLVSQSTGLFLPPLTGGEVVGSFLIPNSSDDGWMFRIADFDGTFFTVDPITASGESITLDDGPGAAGPQLVAGEVYDFLIVPSLQIGGGGGGGSGVSVTGTLNDAPSVLPHLTPGAGGGAGGGSLLLETASSMVLGPLCQLLAEGGSGGMVFDLQAKYAGGGGGGGGNVVIRAGKSLDIFLGARISVAGGAGGSEAGFGRGGTGGAGFIRFEDFADSLSSGSLSQFTTPVVTAENVGRMLGELEGVGQSLFYTTPVANPEWKSVEVEYFADTDGKSGTEPFVWGFDDTGAVSTTGAGEPFPDGLSEPPIRLQVNSVGFDELGFLDSNAQDSVFYEAYDLVSARVGLAYDSDSGVLLYCVGDGARQVHRLDTDLGPASSGPTEILFPFIPAVGSDTVDLLSTAVDNTHDEFFLLERDTFRVHVLSLATGAFLRTIQLPAVITGAMTYLPDIDRLVVADNRNDQLLVFRPRDPVSGLATQDYSPSAAEAQYDLRRDTAFLDGEIVGLAYDAGDQTLWCTDARAGRLFQVSMASGSEGTSSTNVEAFSPLLLDGGTPVPVIPSAVAFDGIALYLVHAVDRDDARVRSLDQGDVDPTGSGASTLLPDFGALLPEGPSSICDGDMFLRFKLLIDGEAVGGSTQFSDVSVDSVGFVVENQAF